MRANQCKQCDVEADVLKVPIETHKSGKHIAHHAERAMTDKDVIIAWYRVIKSNCNSYFGTALKDTAFFT